MMILNFTKSPEFRHRNLSRTELSVNCNKTWNIRRINFTNVSFRTNPYCHSLQIQSIKERRQTSNVFMKLQSSTSTFKRAKILGFDARTSFSLSNRAYMLIYILNIIKCYLCLHLYWMLFRSIWFRTIFHFSE